MLSFEDDDGCEHGPKHSTPIKGREHDSNKQRMGHNSYPTKGGDGYGNTGIGVNGYGRGSEQIVNKHLNSQHLRGQHTNTAKQAHGDSTVDISKLSAIEDTSHCRPGQHNPPSCICYRSENNNSTDATLGNDSKTVSYVYSDSDDGCSRRMKQSHNGHQYASQRCSLADSCYKRSRHAPCQSEDQRDSHSAESFISQYLSDSSSPVKGERMRQKHMVRSNSAPRCHVACMNTCNHSNDEPYRLASCSEFKKSPAIFIEQDIITKQRQEIQLLMEELGTRDQELNDLVMSHQKQVKAWETDCNKLNSLKYKVAQYEEELKDREEQLKDALSEMAQVNQQRDMEAHDLQKTKDEMVRLAERIKENSLYIQEMEMENRKLSGSLKDYATAQKMYAEREMEVQSSLEEKDGQLLEKQKEVDRLAEHIKFLECRCEELEEKNSNVIAESTAWKRKYCQAQDAAERLTNECQTKDDNIHKMTQQLHESLQQAIALQKALFTSCEREKCKEEVMLSLRKQHKRTMQELNNIRELYDRQNRDLTLYHLSVREGETSGTGARGEGGPPGAGDESRRKGTEKDKYKPYARQRQDKNMSFHDGKQTINLEDGDRGLASSYLVKEMKGQSPRRGQSPRAGQSPKSGQSPKRTSNVTGGGDYISAASQYKDTRGKVIRDSAGNVIRMVKNEQLSPISVKASHPPTITRNATTITSCTSLYPEEPSSARRTRTRSGSHDNSMKNNLSSDVYHPYGSSMMAENVSKNAENRSPRSLSDSRAMTNTSKAMKSRTTSPIITWESPGKHKKVKLNDPPPKTKTEHKQGAAGAADSSSDVSHIMSPKFDDELTPADSDGMCHELKRDISRIGTECSTKTSPQKEINPLPSEPKPSKLQPSLVSNPRKSSFLRKDRVEKKITFSADDECTPSPRVETRKKQTDTDFQRGNMKMYGTDGKIDSPDGKLISHENQSMSNKASPMTRGKYPNMDREHSSSSKKPTPCDSQCGPIKSAKSGSMDYKKKQTNPFDKEFSRGGGDYRDGNDSQRSGYDSDAFDKSEYHKARCFHENSQERTEVTSRNNGHGENCQGRAETNCSCKLKREAVSHTQSMGKNSMPSDSDMAKSVGSAANNSKMPQGSCGVKNVDSSFCNLQGHDCQRNDDHRPAWAFQEWGLAEIDAYPSQYAAVIGTVCHAAPAGHPGNFYPAACYDRYKHQQGVMSVPKAACEFLPADVSLYVTQQRPLLRNLYINNNKLESSQEESSESDGGKVKERPQYHTESQYEGDGNKSRDEILLSNQRTKSDDQLCATSSSQKVDGTTPIGKDKPEKIDKLPAPQNVRETTSKQSVHEIKNSAKDPKALSGDEMLSYRNYYYHEITTDSGATSDENAARRLRSQQQMKKPVANTKSEPTAKQPQPFAQIKGPSLYKNLARIHFSEKSRRYEWINQLPTDTESDGDMAYMDRNKSTDTLSSDQDSLGHTFLKMDRSSSAQSQNSTHENIRTTTPECMDRNRSHTGSSDSGLHSVSERSSGNARPSDKLSAHNLDKSDQRPSSAQLNRSHDSFVEKKIVHGAKDIFRKDFKKNADYNSNCNNNNNKDLPQDLESSCIPQKENDNHNPISEQNLSSGASDHILKAESVQNLDQTEKSIINNSSNNNNECLDISQDLDSSYIPHKECAVQHPSHPPAYGLDQVVKKLDFDDTIVDGSRVEADEKQCDGAENLNISADQIPSRKPKCVDTIEVKDLEPKYYHANTNELRGHDTERENFHLAETKFVEESVCDEGGNPVCSNGNVKNSHVSEFLDGPKKSSAYQHFEWDNVKELNLQGKQDLDPADISVDIGGVSDVYEDANQELYDYFQDVSTIHEDDPACEKLEEKVMEIMIDNETKFVGGDLEKRSPTVFADEEHIDDRGHVCFVDSAISLKPLNPEVASGKGEVDMTKGGVLDWVEKELYSKDDPVKIGRCQNNPVVNTLQNLTSLNFFDNHPSSSAFAGEKYKVKNVDCYNIVTVGEQEEMLNYTKDSNVSTPPDESLLGMKFAPAWVYEDSVEEVAEQFDDKLSSFLTDPADESVMPLPPMSPATKLYRLLMESQEMVRTLEMSSAIPSAIRQKVSMSSSHR